MNYIVPLDGVTNRVVEQYQKQSIDLDLRRLIFMKPNAARVSLVVYRGIPFVAKVQMLTEESVGFMLNWFLNKHLFM